MPCYRCGKRQADPVRGVSSWRSGVRLDQQVLVCPDCQSVADWAADLDRCARCSSTALIRRLGRTDCRDCEAGGDGSADGLRAGTGLTGAGVAGNGLAGNGLVGNGLAGYGLIGAVPVGLADDEAEDGRGRRSVGVAVAGDSDLARDVAAAIDRVLGRGL